MGLGKHHSPRWKSGGAQFDGCMCIHHSLEHRTALDLTTVRSRRRLHAADEARDALVKRNILEIINAQEFAKSVLGTGASVATIAFRRSTRLPRRHARGPPMTHSPTSRTILDSTILSPVWIPTSGRCSWIQLRRLRKRACACASLPIARVLVPRNEFTTDRPLEIRRGLNTIALTALV